jgi:hypothetical protein
MRYELRDRVVFITGASSGIGRACAVEFHRVGSLVVAAARSLDKLEALKAELGSDRIAVVAMDVTDSSQRTKALRFARDRFGSVDVLVNNAGWASFGSLARTPMEHLEYMAAVHFLGPIALIQDVLPEMIQRRGGQLVIVSSVVASQPMPRMAGYCGVKAAIRALATALRMELRGTGVDVILVTPGSTRTSFFETAALTDTRPVRSPRTQSSPERVARAIIRASRNRRRDVTIGLDAKAISLVRRFSHRLADAIVRRVAERTMPIQPEKDANA